MPDRLMTVREATEYLRCSRTSLYRLMRRGELRRIKVGNRTLFTPAAIQQFVESHQQ